MDKQGDIYMNRLNVICGNIVSDEIMKLGDAIVNPTNPMMRPGGGVSGDIFRKAGVDMLENYTSQKYDISYFNPPGKNEMEVTDVRITPGFLLNKDIIFAQGPKVWEYDNYETAFHLLLETYTNIINAAKSANYKSIITPSLGTGEYGFEHNIIARPVTKHLKNLSEKYDIIINLVLYSKELEILYKLY